MAIVTPNQNSVAAPEATWQHHIKSAIRDPRQLCRILELPSSLIESAIAASDSFPLFAPWPYVDKIKPGCPDDPLLRQILPVAAEQESPPEFVSDPVGDHAATLQPGLLQKYHGRALLITTGACAVHCRYCFRREFPYSDGPRSLDQWRPALDRIASDQSIDEVLLSGGDPLTLVDQRLADLAEQLSKMDHVRRIRIHTRLPIMIPQRVCDSLLAWLTGSRLTPIVVIHANHPNELDPLVGQALGRLAGAGVPLLNQAVLLRGVNDDEATLEKLCRRLVDLRVMPYYLHQLDRVRGAAHFEVPVSRGHQLIQYLRERLPGYAVPRYVKETEGQPSKQLL